MIHKTLEEEKKYLESVIKLLKQKLSTFDGKITDHKDDISKSNEYLWENIYELDPEEIASMREVVTSSVSVGNNMLKLRNNIMRLIPSPYFGRIDFKNINDKEAKPVYIGLYNFMHDSQSSPVIYDWRAPISGMFYDYELGNASYESPTGIIEGTILIKRQYRIRNSKIEYMIESGIAINDSILQQELSASSNNKMKGIVATIQREQNRIIRNETARTLIIQGAAGSGKSSIALHRAAFLLYRQKDKLTSKNILIISPNKVFADYISNVLPSLGEERISEVSFDDIAKKELKGICQYQTFFEQVEELALNKGKELAERIKYKSSNEILSQIKSYITKQKSQVFKPKAITIATLTIPASFIIQEYYKYSRLTEEDKEVELANCIQHKVERELRIKLPTDEKRRIRNEVRSMFQKETIQKLYENFYTFLGRPELFKKLDTNKIEFSDVFPLIYMKMLYLGYKEFSFVKHLIVDEMQDYTPVQYNVISLMFKCDKTILGDSYQAVTPYSSSVESISKVFPDAECIYLKRSYRSTFEIIKFAQNIIKDKDIIPYERHGADVKIYKETTQDKQIECINNIIEDLRSKNAFKNIGIICKTQHQAQSIYSKLSSLCKNVYLLDEESRSFINGTVVSSIHMSKGLEFDAVIVPDASNENYNNDMDRNLLYIACTRAMHYLCLTYTNEPTVFIKNCLGCS